MASRSSTSYRDTSESRQSYDANDTEQAGLLTEDVEKGQDSSLSPLTPHHEDTVSTNKKLVYLAGYFLCNIGLTLYNKAILGSVSLSQASLSSTQPHPISVYPLE
jgi:hypothetical protein